MEKFKKGESKSMLEYPKDQNPLHKSMGAKTVNQYFIPFIAGISGFVIFLLSITGIEFILHLTGIIKHFKIGIFELLISTLGFLLQFTYKLFDKK